MFGIDIPSVASCIDRQGVQVRGIWGEHQAFLDRVATCINQLDEVDFDLIIVTVKAFQTDAVSQVLKPYIKDTTYVLLAQNGYGNYEAACKYIAAHHLVLGRVIFGAVTLQPGISEVTVIADDVLIGQPEQLLDTARLQVLAEVFSRAGIPTRVSPNIMDFLWAKIIYNSALNPLGAILEVPYGKLAEMEWSRQLMDQIISEIFAFLKALKQPVPWEDAEAYRSTFYQQLLPSTAAHRASMLQDIQQGRKTEIEALNGAVVRLGEGLGIETPVNRVITWLIQCKEALGLSKA